MRRALIIILLIVLIGGLGVTGWYIFSIQDRQGPEIILPAGQITYVSGTSTHSLLEGVRAVDDRDGDVSDSLRIGNILVNPARANATVVYTAKDSSNNVTQLSRRVQYVEAEIPDEEMTEDEEAEAEAEAETDQEAEAAADAGTDAAEAGADSDTEEASAEAAAAEENEPVADAEEISANEAARQALPPEAPKLYLTVDEVTIDRGTNFNRLSYVEDIVDDVDSRESLYRNIMIDNDVDTWTAGTYTLTYYCEDSSGNRSNDAVLTVTVR